MELTPLDKAVMQALHDGNGDLKSLEIARRAVQDSTTFDSIFIGILAAATPKEVWAEAIERAKKSYATYRAL